MGQFLKRHAVFVLFPAVVVAIVFLGRIVIASATRFGGWGEQSIVESSFVLAREKVTRIEEAISLADHAFFRIVNPRDIDSACERWQQAVHANRIIEAAAVVDEEGGVVQFFHRDADPARALAIYNLLVTDVVPSFDPYDALEQHKHIHRAMGDGYRLVTALTTRFEDQDYTLYLFYDTREIVGVLFDGLLGDIGPERIANVIDDNDRRVWGDDLSRAGAFIVVQRFPSSLYKWRLQLAPQAAAFYAEQAERQRFSEWLLIPPAFAIIVFGLAVLYLAMVRERRLNRLKSEFISNVSHELKTPLALIRMFTELLSMNRVRDANKARQYYEIILRETERLTALIDNVLDFSKIERGKSEYEFKPVRFDRIVEPAVEMYRHRADEAGVLLEYSAEPDLPLVRADGDAITLLLINLVDNALKYGVGTDRIGVALRGDAQHVYLEVFDRGAGIPAHHLKRIFDRFYRYQASDLDTHGHRGSGIGLSLVRHIAKAHGGLVSVTSTPGVETRFTVRFPAAKGAEEAT
ncbi:MAG: HAMP domain-containing histidine kinase [Proteobacteria bacterium]|nr:HAMP domain-containing histidine kinase [Pseudomonadota bacterium]